MIEDFMKCHDFLCNLTAKKQAMNKVFINYLFFNETEKRNEYEQKIKESKLIIINEFKKVIENATCQYLIIGFEKTIIIHKITQYSKSFIQSILSINSSIPVCYLSNSKAIINEIITIHNQVIEVDKCFEEEIFNFQEYIIGIKLDAKNTILPHVLCCISGYLIKKSYLNLPKYRISHFVNDIEKDVEEKNINEQNIIQENIYKDEYIYLRNIGAGSNFKCDLIYHITREELYVIKKPLNNNDDNKKLINREVNNYSKIGHPFFPKFYGKVKNTNYLVIEFINGTTLDNIEQIKLTYKDKIIIIFELMLVLSYLHENELIYRDLKPDNVMINENKTVVLIDFNSLIEKSSDQKTFDLANRFSSPEVINNGIHSYKTDIYSLGNMIEYILKLSDESFENTTQIKSLILMCKDESEKDHHFVTELIMKFNSMFQSKVKIEKVFTKFNDLFESFKTINRTYKIQKADKNNPEIQFNLGVIYYFGIIVTLDIDKAIYYYSLAADQSFPQAQFNLGFIYCTGNYIKRNIEKAIYYLSLAADQNFPQAQFNLGIIFSTYGYEKFNISKAIHYYTLAASNNIVQAQYNLGIMYYIKRYGIFDIKKAIYYLSKAANQNHRDAQFVLAYIYHFFDINKTIYYLSQAASQNDPRAQIILGALYMDGQYIKRKIDKTIYYFSLAAKQNYPEAQYHLGLIYYNGYYVIRDINKTIYYFTLAASKNHPGAQYHLGLIYYNGDYVIQEIDKAIHYFSLAASKNHPGAQYHLGLIYYHGDYIPRDIGKAIYYFSLSASQHHPAAQFKLGDIYSSGIYIKKDIDKSIHYYTLAANQNYNPAQYILGIELYLGLNLPKNIIKGMYYIILASKNGNRDANYSHGFLLHEGKNIERNIKEAIHYYKEASSFNNQYAKNNLGIIYKHGCDEIKINIGTSIEYFTEAINQKNDYLSMYNLAHIYLYNETIEKGIDKSIELLFKSSTKFSYSGFLLCLALIKKFGFNSEIIKQTIEEQKDIPNNISKSLYKMTLIYISAESSLFYSEYESYRTKDFLYDIFHNPIEFQGQKKMSQDPIHLKFLNNISSGFYDGFGHDLCDFF